MKTRSAVAVAAVAIILGLIFTASQMRTRRQAVTSGATTTASLPPEPSAASRGVASDFAPYCQNMYHAICQRTGATRDPTGIVAPDIEGEVHALRTFEEIIRDHPDWSRAQVDEELATELYTPKHRARVEAALHWVRKKELAFIEAQPEEVFNRREKDQLEHRLSHVELQLPPPASLYEDEPDLFTKDDIYYERTQEGSTTKMRLRFGGAYFLETKSWFNLVFTIGHELAHSIDPCELRAARISIPAYDRLTACFMIHGLVAMRKTRDECGEDDQLSETFADWMAVQVTRQALAAFSTEFHGPQLLNATTNAVRDLCEQEDEDVDTEFHPPPKVRIQKIFGDNPGIRSLLGCAPVKEYCDFNFSASE